MFSVYFFYNFHTCIRWYRDKKGNVAVLHPESKMASDYKFRTNWITFYK